MANSKKQKRKKSKKLKLKKNIRFKSLDIASVPRVRKELLDYTPEFLNHLKQNHPEEYKYLAQFTDEWVGASISRKKNGDAKMGHINTKKDDIKKIYDANNRRNNDVLGVSKANSLLMNLDQVVEKNDGWYVKNASNTEDALVSEIDNNNNTENFELLSFEEFLKVKNNMIEDVRIKYEKLYEKELKQLRKNT